MKQERIPIAKEGAPFCGVPAFLAIIAVIGGSNLLAFIFSLAALFALYFFRDPERSYTTTPGAVISPADGRIVFMALVRDDVYGDEECFKISVFMSPLNVHVNRAPLDCAVTGLDYQPGRYMAADKEAASRENERNRVFLHTEDGRRVVVTQVSGFIARRIVCWAEVGDSLKQGERFGLIRFGSRVDVLLPKDFVSHVQMGSRVRAGQTTLGVLP